MAACGRIHFDELAIPTPDGGGPELDAGARDGSMDGSGDAFESGAYQGDAAAEAGDATAEAGDGDASSGDGAVDAAADAGAVGCQTFGAWSSPEPVAELNTTSSDWMADLTPDGLTIYFVSSRSGGAGGLDVWHASRADPGSAFGPAENQTDLNDDRGFSAPSFTADGLYVLFGVSSSNNDLYAAVRSDLGSPFSAPAAVVELNSADTDWDPYVSPDGLTACFSSSRPGGMGSRDIVCASRTSRAASFDSPVHLSEINSGSFEGGPFLTPDGLDVYFSSRRAGGMGDKDLYHATRASTGDPFGAPTPVTQLNSVEEDEDPVVSADGLELYFSSVRGGNADIYRARRDCLD